MLVSELFSLEIEAFVDAFLTIPGLVLQFCTLLDQSSPLNSLCASYFTKIMILLITKKAPEVSFNLTKY